MDRLSDYDYALPEELIAQHPVEPRDHSRLMVVDQATGAIEHHHFYDLPRFVDPGTLFVANNTRVIRARGRNAVGRLRHDLHRLVMPLARLERRGLELLLAIRAVHYARVERRRVQRRIARRA